MIRMTASFNWTGKGVGGRLPGRRGIAHAALDSQIIKDTDPFVPFRTGMLASSPLRSSQPGIIHYNTPYARSCYYGVGWNFRKAFHPQATWRWLEKSKPIWIKRWTRIVASILAGGRP